MSNKDPQDALAVALFMLLSIAEELKESTTEEFRRGLLEKVRVSYAAKHEMLELPPDFAESEESRFSAFQPHLF